MNQPNHEEHSDANELDARQNAEGNPSKIVRAIRHVVKKIFPGASEEFHLTSSAEPDSIAPDPITSIDSSQLPPQDILSEQTTVELSSEKTTPTELSPAELSSVELSAVDAKVIQPIFEDSIVQIPIAATLPQEVAKPCPLCEEPSRAVLMVRDPFCLYAYWRLSGEDYQRYHISEPQGAPPLLLRVYDQGENDQASANDSWYDLTISSEIQCWYLQLPREGGFWRVAIGFLDEDGELVTICVSNIVQAPRVTMTAQQQVHRYDVEPQATIVTFEHNTNSIDSKVENIAQQSSYRRYTRVIAHNHPPVRIITKYVRLGGASEFPFEFDVFSESESVSQNASSEAWIGLQSGRGEILEHYAEKHQTISKPSDSVFPLEVHTELIVYGSTLPDALVSFRGTPVKLQPDGSFFIRCSLVEGIHEFPVCAVSVDGVHRREVTPVVTRETRF